MYSNTWPPIQVFLDWDGTLTMKDTLQLVANIGYKRNPTSRPWDYIVQAYLNDYSAHQSSYPLPKEQRRTIAEESAWLASLGEVENRSINRVQDAGLFLGVTKADVFDAANRAIRSHAIELRDGWTDLFFEGMTEGSIPGGANIGRDGVRFHILSVNWSVTFIKLALLEATKIEYGVDLSNTASVVHPALRQLISVVHFANEIESVSRPISGPESERITVRTSADKLRVLRKAVEYGQGRPRRPNVAPVTVYVGDSATDFNALLYVDVGICIRDDPMGSSQQELAETLERVGVPVRPISELEWPMPGQPLWWTKDLAEVSAALSKILPNIENWNQRTGIA